MGVDASLAAVLKSKTVLIVAVAVHIKLNSNLLIGKMKQKRFWVSGNCSGFASVLFPHPQKPTKNVTILK